MRAKLVSMSEMRYVLAASYENVEDALAAYESIDVAYRHKALGEVLDQGHAGLVIVYGPDMADRVGAGISTATSSVRRSTDISPERLAADLHAADASATASE